MTVPKKISTMHCTTRVRHPAWSNFILLAACFVFGAPLAARAAAPDFVLAKDGRAQAVIVPYGGDTNGLAFAANELAEFLGRLSGAAFMVAEKPVPGYKTLLVGAPYQPSEEQELRVRVKDASTLEVTGDGPLGALYAAYDLLETLGCVFVSHDYTYAPTTNLLAVAGDYAKGDAPWMKLRNIWTELESHVPYMMRLRLQGASGDPVWNKFGGKRVYAINHSIGGIWFRDRELRKQHPEWFAYLRKGDRRSFGWVCVSNEEMYQQLFKEIAAYLGKHPGIPEVSVAIGDCSDFCECDKCLAEVEKYRDVGGEDVFSCQYLILANRVAKHFARDYPGVRFNILAYGERQPSGNNITMEPNVGAFVAELWRNHGLPADCNPRGAYCMQHIAAISPKSNPPYVWEYQANFRDFLIPFPNLKIFAQSARYYKRLGVRAIMAQNQYAKIGDLSEMKLWLYAKLTWNPDADQETLIDTYLKAASAATASATRRSQPTRPPPPPSRLTTPSSASALHR